MERYAQLLALRYDQVRTRHSYYRHMRLIDEHFDCPFPPSPARVARKQPRSP